MSIALNGRIRSQLQCGQLHSSDRAGITCRCPRRHVLLLPMPHPDPEPLFLVLHLQVVDPEEIPPESLVWIALKHETPRWNGRGKDKHKHK